ncbi:PrgI family mobile element protein [Micromonospora sp. DT48]|uniref:PrgI family mobile element protein n=1 Tax=Micromonospora sp. DT48 TaxID=3393429 RepID=UPI003CEF9543
MSDVDLRARIPADVEAPDRLLYQLSPRQVAILATAAAVAYLLWRALLGHVPMPVLLAALVPLLGAATVLALGRRDGLSLDAWLVAAVRGSRTPRRQVPVPGGKAPRWAPRPVGVAGDLTPPALLRLPARAIAANGVVDLGGSSAAMVAVTTVNLGLRTSAEQAALVGAYARWLNGLTAPVQIVVSTQPVDLAGHAQRIADAADLLPSPALADAAADYAEFLLDVEEERQPLWRTVTIVHTATGARRDTDVLRAAEHTAAALQGVGAATRVLDGPAVAAVLAAAVDPYTLPLSGERALPDEPVTGGQR